jgi:hypothetical protein
MSKKNDRAKEYEQVMPFKLPSNEDWEEAARTLGLSESGKACLLDLLMEINADVEMLKLYVHSHLTREESIKRLKDIEKAAKALRAVLIKNEKLLPDFIPHKALEEIGSLFTFPTITKAIGREPRSEEFIEATHEALREESDKFSDQMIEDGYARIKADVGLAYAGKLLVHALDTLIRPIEEWHKERKRQSKGGRTINRSRRDFILVLAMRAEKIIGERPSADVKSKFFDLCELVFEICGVPQENLKNLIGEVLRETGSLT